MMGRKNEMMEYEWNDVNIWNMNGMEIIDKTHFFDRSNTHFFY